MKIRIPVSGEEKADAECCVAFWLTSSFALVIITATPKVWPVCCLLFSYSVISWSVRYQIAKRRGL